MPFVLAQRLQNRPRDLVVENVELEALEVVEPGLGDQRCEIHRFLSLTMKNAPYIGLQIENIPFDAPLPDDPGNLPGLVFVHLPVRVEGQELEGNRLREEFVLDSHLDRDCADSGVRGEVLRRFCEVVGQGLGTGYLEG